jgi:hypothetical protein
LEAEVLSRRAWEKYWQIDLAIVSLAVWVFVRWNLVGLAGHLLRVRIAVEKLRDGKADAWDYGR